MLPPRAVRRFLLAPLVVVLGAVAALLSPVAVAASTACARLAPRRGKAVRVAGVADLYLAHEAAAVLACLALWAGGGAGERMRSPEVQRRHYALMAWFLRSLQRWCDRLAGLRVSVDDEGAGEELRRGDEPVIVLSRHAGPGDTFLIVNELLNRYGRRPRIVMKAALQLDPCIDLAGNRLPNVFLARGPGAREACIAEISRLAAGMSGRDALLIFPEGGNFTEERRRRAILRLRRRRRRREAARAERMRNVIAPEPGGTLAALAAAPGARVLFVAHTGLAGMQEGGPIRRAPIDTTLAMRLWLVPAGEVPESEQDRVDWLYGWWARIDAWIESHAIHKPV